MKELEYVYVTDLVRLRLALDILRPVCLGNGVNGHRIRTSRGLISKVISDLEPNVEAMMENEDAR